MDWTSALAHSPWGLLLLATALALSSFALHGRQGINLADEGFLWYGVQRTMAGELPLLDFQAYDPGRYYWCALGAFIYGKGLVALRFSENLFQIIGLWVGLLIATRMTNDGLLIAAIGVVLLLWMFPSFKLFDHSSLLVGIWIAVRLIEEPSLSRTFIAGAFVGFSVFFGRNHALYNLLAQSALLLVLKLKLSELLLFPQLGVWIAGIAIGLVPMIAVCLCRTGVAASYLDSILSILRNGTNLPLPIPWPWRVSPFKNTGSSSQFLLGLFLIALPLVYLIGIVVALVGQRETIQDHSVLIGSSFVGLFYLHHAFSRADISHLAQAIHPFLLGILALSCSFGESKFYPWSAIAILVTTARLTVSKQSSRYLRFTSAVPWEPFDAGGIIFVPQRINRLLTCLRKFASENFSPHESILIAPSSPALYPILNLKAPCWDLAFYFPAAEPVQEKIIQNLKMENVNWVILSDTTTNQRENMRFSTTHAFLAEHLKIEFEPVKSVDLPESTTILRRKRAS
ncbi:MAG: hypothetical protein ABI016_03010 [Chthoniobacterales bacterium]